eukprot:scaffold527071_cov18-Prasinocladus_malaysianus.AAC.1
MDRAQDAFDDAQAAINIDERHAKGYLRRAGAQLKLEKYQEAINDYEKVKELDPDTSGLVRLPGHLLNTILHCIAVRVSANAYLLFYCRRLLCFGFLLHQLSKYKTYFHSGDDLTKPTCETAAHYQSCYSLL